MSSINTEKTIKFRFTDKRINSIEIKITIRWRRVKKTPNTPNKKIQDDKKI